MLIVAAIVFAAGGLLGLRYRFLILLPATLVAVAVIVAQGLIASGSAGQITLTAVVATVALQFGYVAGMLIRGQASKSVWLSRLGVVAPTKRVPTSR